MATRPFLAAPLLLLAVGAGCSAPAPSFEDRRAEEHNRAGAESFRHGDLAAAALHFEQALETAKGLGNRRQQVDALNNLGIVNETLGRQSEALELYQQGRALAAAEHVEDDAFVSDYLGGLLSTNLNLARLLLARGDREGARAALAGAGRAAEELGSRTARADVLKQEALYVLATAGAGEAALSPAIEATRLLEIAEQNPQNVARHADARLVLGRVLAAAGRNVEAVAEFRGAAELAKSLSDRPLTAAALESMGDVFEGMNLYTDARIRYEIALDVHLRVPNAGRARSALLRLEALAKKEQRPDLVQRFQEQLAALEAGTAKKDL